MDVLKIALTPLEAITAHATLVINLQQILRPVLVNKTSSIAEYHATMLAALHSYLTMLFFLCHCVIWKILLLPVMQPLDVIGVHVNIFAVLIPMGIFWTIAIVFGFKCIQRMRKGNIVYRIG